MLVFHDDYPLYNLYKKILTKLEDLTSNKDAYIAEYQKYKKISECSHNPEDRQAAYTKHLKMERVVSLLENDTLVTSFKSKTLPIVHAYNDSQGNEGYVFGMNTKVNIPKRVSIIISFMEAVNTFVPMKWECTFNMSDVCPKCYSYTETRGNIMFCVKCGSSYGVDPSEGKSSDPDDTVKESTYKSSKNYRKEFMHLCGLQHSCETDEVDNIRSYLYRSDCKEPTRNDIRLAIPRCGYKNYNDTNYIYTAITKADLPPISDYIVPCTERFEKYYEEFDRQGMTGNITNLHFLTKLFLFQEEVPTEDDWFRQLSTKTEQRHRDNAIKISKILSQKFPESNWTVPPEWTS
jgi:hypothetical protein